MGSINEVKAFEKTLPISDILFDFRKIISPPEEFYEIYDHTSSDQRLKIYDWRTSNWGTTSNGIVYKTARTYFEPETTFEFQIVTACDAPTLVLNKIIKNHRNLFYLMHQIDYLDNELIAYRAFDDTDFNIICNSYRYMEEDFEKSGCDISLKHLCGLQNYKLNQPQKDFIMSFEIGKFIIKYV